MEKISIEEILKAIDGKLIKDGKSNNFSEVFIDSRKKARDGIFFGLKGEKVNGSKYAAMASENGASLVIIDEMTADIEKVKDYSSVILVKDAKEALKNLAKYYRGCLKIKVVGITGSNGKTSTKDLAAAVLSSRFKVLKTEGNFNNEIGLPLTVFKLDNSYDAAVLEMGMSNLGEIHSLTDIARPDIGIITNIGVSHLQNLKTRENILKAKLEITDFFKKENTLIINGDNDLLKDYTDDKFSIIKAGKEKYNNIYADDIKLLENGVSFSVYEDGKYMDRVFIDSLGEHSVTNSILAAALGRKMGLTYTEIKKGLKNSDKTKMRLEVIDKTNYKIVNDCYNASPDSMKAAIDVIKSFKGRKIAVLGTMLELGENSGKMHREVGRYAKENGADMLLATGDFKDEYFNGFGNGCYTFSNKSDLALFLKDNISQDDVILIKASRGMKFETIIEELN
ncbi:MAG: UDP-N-acetylmuramoyl-tripeptide--D-alanyl-D-alanine ligase [Bacillota bacterium]|nr:UDP-N-acetylmuramoyl-tripeptide--D-alanyl-D-alanine ligase [Bacillota bacterium]